MQHKNAYLKRPLIAVKNPAPFGGEAGLEERLVLVTCALSLTTAEEVVVFIFVVEI